MKKKNTKSTAQDELPVEIPNDTGTIELRQHFEVMEEGHGRRKQARVLNHPLDKYFREQAITLEQYRAGRWLFNDWASSHQHRGLMQFLGDDIKTRGQSNYEYPHGCWERFNRVIKALNPVSKRLAQAVCIEGYTLRQIHGSMHWRRENSGMDRLCEMLDDLFRIYEEEWKNKSDYVEKHPSCAPEHNINYPYSG